jgi:5'-deoxynucleotidase YfbR-like HD superfamily hydrolase
MDLKHRFPPEFRTIAVVPRWSIVVTIQKDFVAGHSAFVTFYAREIAILIEWPGDFADLMFRALVHDAEEAIMGDIVSPVKAHIIDDNRAADYIDGQMRQRMPFIANDLAVMEDGDPDEDGEAWAIVRAADKYDALAFAIMECRLGNQIIAQHLPRAWNKLEAAWRALPADKDKLDFLWNTCIVPSIKQHETDGGAGLAD